MRKEKLIKEIAEYIRCYHSTYNGDVSRAENLANQVLLLVENEELDAWAKANVYANLADIKAIMKNAPDLRSLERQLANYLGERRRLETDTD